MKRVNKPKKICTVAYELLFYSGKMPRSVNSKPKRTLLAKVIPNGTKSIAITSGEADYAILTVNNIPCSFATVGHTKGYDVNLACTYLVKGQDISIDNMTA